MSYTRIPTVKEACELEADALDFALSDQVEHLTDLIAETEGKVDAFFDRNHVTHGMERLLREGLQRLNGKTGQAVFQLTQAMGGGKTHSMLALGLLARNPHLYSRVPASITAGLEGSKARVVAINGRQISNDIFLWGEIAEQLGKKEQFSKFWKSVPDAPREQDWIDVIGDEPTLILLDELPPYFDYAKTRAVGSGTLANVTTYALSNLLSAAMKLPRTAIVVSNLTGSYQGATQDLAKAIKDIAEETKRQARSITPVDLSGNEIYDILRKRMFKKLPSKAEIEKVADAYGEAINLAERSKTIPKSPEQIADEVIGSYPFHPSVKNIIALFRNNENYRQTRGLMQFVSKMLKSVWEGEQSGNVYLVGCQHLDLTIPDVREEVNRIGDLQGAMARDVIATDGSAHAQIIDANRGTDSATQAAKLLLSASLSDSVDAVKGLTKATLVEYLIAPERSASEFDEAFESLTKEAWYLHRGETNKDVWYFSNVENLRKRIQNRAQSAPIGKIEEEMRRRLKNAFEPSSKKAYSTVYALPRIDEIETNQQNRFCLVLSPDSKTPPDEAQKFLESVTTKNSFCVVTGESSNLGNLEEKVRAIWAIAKVRAELGEKSPHLPEIQELEENSEFDFNSALTTLFNRVYFPMPTLDRKGTRLTHTAIKLSVEKGSSGKSAPNVAGEAAVEAALAAIGAKKLIIDYDQNLDSLIERAEDMLWPEKTTRIPWADVVLRSKSNARWPWLPPKGLEAVRDHAVSIGRWTYDGDGYVDKMPPKPVTSASISERSYDPETGISEIEIFPLNAGPAPKIWVSKTGDFNTSSEQLDGSLLTTTDTKLWFLVKDPTDAHEQGDSVVWINKLTLTYQPRFALGKRTVELNVVPRGEIRWNITGANEKEGAVYSGPIELEGSDKVTIYAYASDKGVGVSKEFVVPATESDQQIDPKRKATYKKQMERTGVADAFNLLKAAEDNKAKLAEVTIAIGDGTQTMRTRFGSDTVLTPDYVREVIALGRKGLGSENAVVKITVKNTAFDSGYDLEQFFKALGEDVQAKDVEQA